MATTNAILSHTWDRNGEQSLQELKEIQERYATRPTINDSCCINKSSSAELSEAINSMYAWYAGARVCYAYLVDVSPHDDHRAQGSQFRQSVWFKRGWTLQELTAPYKVILLSQDVIGSRRRLVDLIEGITGITSGVLLHEASLDKFSVAERLFWASTRVTTRAKDEACCLLGIFDINMPTLYGEGERTFRRLQEQIMQHVPDQSLFVGWSRVYTESEVDRASNRPFFCMRNRSIASFFAQAPSSFELASTVHAVPHHDVYRRLHLSQTPAPEYNSTPHPSPTAVSHEVTIAVSDVQDITVGLGVNLVWESHYALDVRVLDRAQGDAGSVPGQAEQWDCEEAVAAYACQANGRKKNLQPL
uniref:Peptidyl-prolyl cis-trans isomerase (PPIase) (EC) n=1 Tax=Ganoderma boninense TaxID=34458 RepID=A0A5K1K546_9APHY|nr:Peptidyl-prolyl cis-trans isomerase (PPIase) (EC [Ganoderma boninense]